MGKISFAGSTRPCHKTRVAARGFLATQLRLTGLLHAAGFIICVCTVTGFAGAWWWAFDLASHFRAQYAAAGILIAGCCWLLRERRAAIAYAGSALINLGLLSVLFLPHPHPAMTGPSLRVALINVHADNKEHDRVLDVLRYADPDVVVLQEINARWLTHLSVLNDRYPHVITEPREDDFGIGVWSKSAFSKANVLHFGAAEVPSVLVRLDVGSRQLVLLGTHPLPPSDSEGAQLRDGQLAAIAPVLRGQTSRADAVVVLGDLNTTPWSIAYRRLLRTTGLRNSAQGHGFQPTWPAVFPLLLIPIDHCLISTNVNTLRHHIGPAVGSDHYPVIVDLTL